MTMGNSQNQPCHGATRRFGSFNENKSRLGFYFFLLLICLRCCCRAPKLYGFGFPDAGNPTCHLPSTIVAIRVGAPFGCGCGVIFVVILVVAGYGPFWLHKICWFIIEVVIINGNGLMIEKHGSNLCGDNRNQQDTGKPGQLTTLKHVCSCALHEHPHRILCEHNHPFHNHPKCHESTPWNLMIVSCW